MKNTSLKKRIVYNSGWNFLSTISSKIGALIFSIILARFLMPERYGNYSIVFATAMIFYTFADLGVNYALSRYLSEASVKNKSQMSPYYRYLLKIKIYLTSVVFFIILILSYPISVYIFKNSSLFIPFISSAFFVFILSLEVFHSQIFYPIEKVKYSFIKELLTQILRIILVLIVFYMVSQEYQVFGIFVSLILVHSVILLLVLFYLKKLAPGIYSTSIGLINKKRVLSVVGFLTIAGISGVFFSYIDSVILGIFILPEYVGYYRAAFSFIVGLTALVSFPNSVLLPFFTKLGKLKTEQLFNTFFRYTAILSLPLSFGLLVLGKFFINLLYGESYLSASLPLYFISFLIVPMAGVATFVSLFSAKEKPQIFTKLMIATSIINIILNLVFIKILLRFSPLWATAGAGIATLISWSFYFIASFYSSKKEFAINISMSPIIKPLISSFLMFILLMFIKLHFDSLNLFKAIIIILIGVIFYFLIMILIKGITKEDINLFKNFLKEPHHT